STRRWGSRWTCSRCCSPSRAPRAGSRSGSRWCRTRSRRSPARGSSTWAPRGATTCRWWRVPPLRRDHVLKTRLCERLGIELPIIAAPMGFVTGPELAAAVSNAGGLGVMSFSGNPAPVLREEIRRLRRLTDRPFGVNLLLYFPVEAQDAVAPTPVAAAGGIADARGVVAALALGAQAAVLGTRFLATPEAAAHPLYKARVMAASEEDTVHTLLFGGGWPDAPHRVLRTPFVEQWLAQERRGQEQRADEPVVGETRMGGARVPVA